MEQSGIHGIFLWFRHLFKIDQYVFALVVGPISFLDIRVQHWLLVLPIKSLSLFCGHWNFFKKVSLLIFDVTLLKSWFFSCITFLTWSSQIIVSWGKKLFETFDIVSLKILTISFMSLLAKHFSQLKPHIAFLIWSVFACL